MLVPFMDPQVYGRSILENSSFIASSVCPDPASRGRGFVARLSGTTAEFIHLWLLLTVGKRPFRGHNNDLYFSLQPALPAQWFTQETVSVQWDSDVMEVPENAFACALFGRVLLVYHNPLRRKTYGPNAVKPVKYLLDGQHEISGPEITGEMAHRIRQRKIKRIDVWLK